jgi:hypothetical protein
MNKTASKEDRPQFRCRLELAVIRDIAQRSTATGAAPFDHFSALLPLCDSASVNERPTSINSAST